MADRTVTIAPSGGDYTTLDAALDAQVAAYPNLTVDNGSGGAGVLNFKIQGSWSSADTAAATVNGFTTSATCYVNIYTDAANRATASGWKTDRYQLVVTDAHCLYIRDDYVRVDGLQIQLIYTAVANKSCIHADTITATNNYICISNCRCIGDMDAASSCTGIRMADVDIICNIYNCIVYDHDFDGILIDDAATSGIYNCTVYNTTNNAIEIDSGTCSIKNCFCFNNVDDFQDDSTTATMDYNTSDDGDGTNAQNLTAEATDWNAILTDYTTGDVRLKNYTTAPCCVDRGVDLSGLSLFTNDIDNNTRGATWDIGAHEYVATGGGVNSVPLIMYFRKLYG